jgi:hypothetical protein
VSQRVTVSTRVAAPPAEAFACREAGEPDGPATEVEVRFAPAAGGGTRVTLEHRGFERFPPDHPARGGLAQAALMRLWGRCWSARLEEARSLVEDRR